MSCNHKSPRNGWKLLWKSAFALLVVSQLLGASPAVALDDAEPDYDDPSGGIPPSPPPYSVPAEGFIWSAEDRYYDWPLAWHERGANKNWPVETYHPEYVNPTSWRIKVQGCQSFNDFLYDLNAEIYDAAPPDLRYQWVFNGMTTGKSENCYRWLPFPKEGNYEVTLKVFRNGQLEDSWTHTIQVEDMLIVVLGDSSASGEGSPDQPLTGGYDGSNADWTDDRCHRSLMSGGAQAARRIEDMDDKTSVTFISFACSGATLDTESWQDTGTLDPYEVNDFSPSRGTGITGWFVGIEPHVDSEDNYLSLLPAQTEALSDALRIDESGDKRDIDALIVAGGINDARFANLAAICVLFEDCPAESVGWEPVLGDAPTLDVQFHEDLQRIGPGWAKLKEQLEDHEIVAHKRLALEYPSFFTDDDGSRCDWIFGDVVPLNLIPPLAGVPIPTGWFFGEIDHAADVWAPHLNAAVADAAFNADFELVTGISDGFDRHGMCADDRYINTARDSVDTQGDDTGDGGFFGTPFTKGLAHPNVKGYGVYADRILDHLTELTTNSPPIPNSDTLWAVIGLPYSSNWTNVLTNDTDPDAGDVLTARVKTLPAHGTIELSSDGWLYYKPKNGFVGDDSFFYEVTDGDFTRTALVSVKITLPTITRLDIPFGSTTTIGGLGGAMTGPFVVVFDKDIPLRNGTAHGIPGVDSILYTANTLRPRKKVRIYYSVLSLTTDVMSPSFGQAIRGKIILRVRP